MGVDGFVTDANVLIDCRNAALSILSPAAGLALVQLLLDAGLVASQGEGKRLIQQ